MCSSCGHRSGKDAIEVPSTYNLPLDRQLHFGLGYSDTGGHMADTNEPKGSTKPAPKGELEKIKRIVS